MDLQMPEMDGYTATRLLRADLRFHDLPIVAMTAHALVEERQRCLDAGMNDHVTKPIDPDALFAALARWTKQRSAAPAEPAIPAPEGAGPALPQIDGVDIAGGLKRVAGNRKLYRTLLEQFVSKEAGAASGIAQALKAGDRAVAERQAHTLKGVAGNIGIGDVQSAAEELEKAIRAGDASAPSLLGDLESVLIPRVAAIRTALSETASEPTSVGVFDANLAAAAVARLNTLLEANDGDAADVVQQVASALTGQVDTSRLAALRDSVDEFDFDDAKAKLAEIAKECNLVL
jgi:HPt (histidine-containing phosphotransfer) domain-containing protein